MNHLLICRPVRIEYMVGSLHYQGIRIDRITAVFFGKPAVKPVVRVRRGWQLAVGHFHAIAHGFGAVRRSQRAAVRIKRDGAENRDLD